MTTQMDPSPSTGDLHGNDVREDRVGRLATTPGSRAPDPRAGVAKTGVAKTVDGSNIQVIELRGTIIRLREQLDQIHSSYEERVQQLESRHRAQRRDLEDTIRHLRDRLQFLADKASDTGSGK